ncbi:PAS domain-containing sensor histidine kinase [Mucilaginibacter conchicola]|uniref:histidine kinase n=1 Tax=Mucilaginibacter conchicola TaxID=2303333 RepID=A0A372NUN0_9SPHI|nr:PAS domain-containing sensor histidine kinase [Mucilaginibacter conchicola]RFZ92983.1 PAS domain-containing sensor histidine kinase [Mucilaginibacter conchicola]
MASFDILFYESHNPMWVFDICTLAILEVNNAAVEAYGYTKKEFLSKTIRDLRPPEDVEQVELLLPEIRATKTHLREFRHKDKAGHVFHVEVMSYPIDFEGHEARLVVTQNVEEKKAIAGELELTQTKLNRMLETTSIGFLRVDDHSTITYWNHAAEQMIGYDRKYLLGKNIWDVFPEAVDTNFYIRYQEAIENRNNAEFESYFWPVQKWFGVIIYFVDEELVIHFRDITETKIYEEELLKKIDQLKEISYLNSHYIRKPVASLLGLTGLINQDLVEGNEYKDIAGHIHECSRELDHVVRRINNKVNDEMGYAVYDQIQNFSLNHLVENVVVEASAFHKDHRLILKNNEEVLCYGNKHSIGAALHRLIDNAAKFSPDGGDIEVCLDVVKHNAILSVHDFGVGIDKATLNRIFMGFTNKKTAAQLGTGLATVSDIAHRHNGNVWVESKPGKGSTFSMRLPMSNIGVYKQAGTTDFSAYQGPGLDLNYLPDDDVLIANWHGFHTLHTVKTGCLRILAEAANTGAKLILNDNTGVAGTWNDAVEWVSSEFFPSLRDGGATHLAWVYSPSTFSRISTDVTIANLDGFEVDIQTFENRDAAMTWLRDAR